MEHKSFFSPNRRLFGVSAVAVSLVFLAVITFMRIHIRNQDAIIIDLQSQIIVFKNRKAADKAELRRISMEELFQRIDEDTENSILR